MSRWGAAAAILAGMVLLGAPLAAHAENPVDLGGAYVLDHAGALSGGEKQQVITALDDLYTANGTQLFVVYVSSFDNPSDPAEWATDTANDNGLGVNDVLLAVAIDDRQYYISVDDNAAISDTQLAAADSAIESQLRQNNWAQAAIDGAKALGPSSSASGGGIPILPILGGVVVVGGGIFVFSRIRRRNKDGSVTTVPEQLSQKQLDQRAGSLLVQLDDSLKTSEQELGFAVAQFGDDATRDFTNVLASAKTKVAQAFTLKQKLDDAQPDSEAEKRDWTTQIIQLCEAADTELDSQADAFDALRQLEKNAPAALAQVMADATAARARIPEATTALATLRDHFAAGAVKPVAENVTQAAQLLDFADEAAAKAKTSIDAGDGSTAAIAVRTAQSSVGQATQLFAAIDTLAADLAEASGKLDAAIADTTGDIAAARALPADSSGTLAPAIAAAEASLALAASTAGDPLASLSQVEKANAALDSVFTGVRDQQAQVARAQAQLDPAISAARAQITSAAEYITTRRGGIGETARTRVSEAERHLQQALALQPTDPVAALAEAQRANELGASAFELAQQDVSSYSSAVPSGGSYRSGGPDLGGLLGGLVGGMIASGGRSRGGGGWSSGGSRSSSRSGSFGGSSRSAGRSSGGRSGRGGRF